MYCFCYYAINPILTSSYAILMCHHVQRKRLPESSLLKSCALLHLLHILLQPVQRLRHAGFHTHVNHLL